MGEPAWPTKRLFAVVSVLVLAVVVIVLGRSVTDRSSPASEGRPGPSVDDQTTLPADRSHSAGHVPRDDLFGTEPFHTEWLDEVMAMRLRVMNDPANRPPPCQPFGSVRWADTTPAQRARIEILTNKRTGSVGGGTWIDTGIETDEQGDYELPPQDICPLRMAAATTRPRPGRGEEHDPPEEDELPFRIRRDIVLEEACSIRGEVRDVNGEPLVAQVAADPSHYLGDMLRGDPDAYSARHPETRGRYFSYTTNSDEDGSFALPSLLSGDWTIHADLDGYRPSFVELHWHDGGACPEPATIELEPDSCWSVFVHDEEGRPIPGAYVRVVATLRTDRSALSSGEVVHTDRDGLADVCNTTPLGSFVECTAEGYGWEGARLQQGETVLDVTLHPGGTLEALLPSDTPDDAHVEVLATHPQHGRDHLSCLLRSRYLRCDSVDAGSVIVRIKIGGFEAWEGAVTITGGETAYLGPQDLVPIPGEAHQRDWDIDPWSL